MKLILQIKLLPDKDQAQALLDTLKEANSACNQISEIMWEQKVWNQYKVHHLVYHSLKKATRLSAQMIIRCISKTVDAYKLDRKRKRTFKPLGAITYDSRILSYKPENHVSIWSVVGRLKIPFVCHNPKLIPYIKGEADLVTKKGKWFLFQTVEVPEDDVIDVEDFIGIDFGIVNLATTSDGKTMSGQTLNQYREKRQRIRSSIQAKGTKGAKKLLKKRLSGREKRAASIANHTIAKRIVETAKESNRGIALENLKGIRKNGNKKGKAFRSKLGKWSFYQLRCYIEYKAKLAGIPIVFVDPRYSSQMCSQCYRIGSRNGESFKCSCGYSEHSDINAALNIRQLALSVNQREQSVMCCDLSHNQVESRLL
jgi:IS605 OrfB family transposase